MAVTHNPTTHHNAYLSTFANKGIHRFDPYLPALITLSNKTYNSVIMKESEILNFTAVAYEFNRVWTHESPRNKRVNGFICTIILFLLYERKRATSLELYKVLPYDKNFTVAAQNWLIDKGYIIREDKKEKQSYVYRISALGSKVVEENLIPPKRYVWIKPKYRKDETLN